MCGTHELLGSGVLLEIHPYMKYMAFGFKANWGKVGSSGFRFGTEKMGARFRPKFFYADPLPGFQLYLGRC